MFPDPEHSVVESRYVIIRVSKLGKLLIISHIDRGAKVRMMSARKATRQEQRFYEAGC
jgi:uncharacterized protein